MKDLSKSDFYLMESAVNQLLYKYNYELLAFLLAYKYLMSVPFVLFYISDNELFPKRIFVLGVVLLSVLFVVDIVAGVLTVRTKTKHSLLYLVANLFAFAYIPYMLYFYIASKQLAASLENIFANIGFVCILAGVIWFFISIFIVLKNLKKGKYRENYPEMMKPRSYKKILAIVIAVLSPLMVLSGSALLRRSIGSLSNLTGGILGALLVLYILILIMVVIMYLLAKIIVYIYYQAKGIC